MDLSLEHDEKRRKALTITFNCRVPLFVCLFVAILQPAITTDGGWRNGFQIWRLVANISNKQLQTADNMWSSIWRLGEGLKTSYRKNLPRYETFHKASDVKEERRVGTLGPKKDGVTGSGEEYITRSSVTCTTNQI
jgi:hypothetical protein